MSLKLPRLAIRGLVIAFALGVTPAFAADARLIADALIAAMTANGKNTATYESTVAEGDDVVVTGLKIVETGGGERETVTLPKLTIVAPVPREKGGFTASKMAIDATRLDFHGESVTWQSLTLENATVPSPDEIKSRTSITPFSRLDVTGITFSGERFPAPVEIASFGAGLQQNPDGTPSAFEMSLSGMKVTPEFFRNNALAGAYLNALGYTNGLVVSFGIAGSYENSTDTLTLSNLAFDATDVGKLTISGKFTGVSLRQLGAMEMGDVQSSGKLEALRLRFDNAGIVERLFDMQATSQGIKREEAVAMATASLPLFLLMVPTSEEFQTKVVDAATKFLNDPKSITVSAAPKEPVPFTTLYDTLGEEPETLPDIIGADITAND